MTFAFADPPYVGQAKKHYGGTEVDHAELIETMVDTYPDGWALSCSSPSLRDLLPLCPPESRIGGWFKPFCSYKPGVGVAYAWEPVIFLGGRKRTRQQPTVRDWVSVNILLKRGLSGAKPDDFCYWLFEVFNAQPGDELHDLFPGTGRVGRAWTKYLAYKAGAQREPAAGATS